MEHPHQVAVGNSNQVEVKVEGAGAAHHQATHLGQVQAVAVVNG